MQNDAGSTRGLSQIVQIWLAGRARERLIAP